MNKKLHPVHPGVVLNQEFLKPLSISQNKIARDIKVSPCRINEIVLGKRCVTADTALRLARYFKTSTQFWMNLQSSYDLEITEQAEDRKDLEVFSKRAKEPTISYGELLKRLNAQSPSTSYSLMQHNLIDEYWLFVNQLLLGVGIPLFKNIKDKINLRLLEANVLSSGVVGLHYEKSKVK